MFGDFIKEQRTKRGMSQEYIASELALLTYKKHKSLR